MFKVLKSENKNIIQPHVGRKSMSDVEVRMKSWNEYSSSEKYSVLLDALQKHAPKCITPIS